MEVKHTHPSYDTEEQRLDRLKEACALCLTAIAQVRGKTSNLRALKHL